ncbi:thiol reductant ABC exporter subunit CydC [uncultured Roseibium sp.]|uniref:thiol reductant ABC exporter subunit CydC n=1 Tax=uncultured Roseibium sp. TaxID=1936171 RepID=UPI0026195A4C|nr:thiol reductant ABC exporter subunit CydC [uncultured Roseibium sp.]
MSPIWQVAKSQFRHDRLHFCLGIIVAILPAAAGLLLLGVSGWFITAAALAGLSGAFLNIFAPSAIIRALAIIRTAGRYGERVLTHDATFRFLSDLRNRLFATSAEKVSEGRRTGLVLNRLTADVAALDTVYLRLVVPISLAVTIAVFLLFIWWTVSASVFLTGLSFMAFWAFLARSVVSRSDRQMARRADAASEAMRLRTADLAAGRRDLAVYGGLDKAVDGILEAERRLQDSENWRERRAAGFAALSGFVGQTFLAAMLLVCIWNVADGTLGVPAAVGLVLAVIALPELVSAVLLGLTNLPRSELAARRTDLTAHQNNKAKTGAGSNNDQPVPADQSECVLSFASVSFTYPGAIDPVLERFSFDVKPGEIVALSGRSGRGKSTIASLAARLRSVDTGQILLNGRNIEAYRATELSDTVTVLGQRPYFFNDTIADNLRVANPSASEQDLWSALERSVLVDRIASDPDGLNCVLGEGGLGLSGGELRRLALARAFLTRPSLFILDEMTEGLDQVTASEVLERFFKFRGTASVLMIAHKQREIESADRVVNLDNMSDS